MPAWTCFPTGAKPPVRGSTAPILTVSWAMAQVDASAPTANAVPSVTDLRIMGFPLCWVEFGGNRYRNTSRGRRARGVLPSVLDCDGVTLDPADLTQWLHRSGSPLAHG